MPSQLRLPAALSSALLVAVLALSGCQGEDAPADATEGDSRTASAVEGQVAIDALVDDGLAHLAQGEPEQARERFEQVLDLDPQNVPALYNLGYLSQLDDDTDSAVSRYTSALAIEKDYVPALYNLAIITESSDLGGAVALYERVVGLAPENARAYTRLGYALQELGRQAEGERMLARGIDLDPAMADVEPPSYG